MDSNVEFMAEDVKEPDEVIVRRESLKEAHDIRHTLAVDRTILANERTLLSYSRTSLTLVVAGLSFMHFSDSPYLWMVGFVFIPVGVFSFIYGYYRFHKKKKVIRREREILMRKQRKEQSQRMRNPIR